MYQSRDDKNRRTQIQIPRWSSVAEYNTKAQSHDRDQTAYTKQEEDAPVEKRSIFFVAERDCHTGERLDDYGRESEGEA